MKNQLQTIRADLSNLMHLGAVQRVIDTVTQLEAMVWEPVALAQIEHTVGGSIEHMPLKAAWKLPMGVRFDLYAAPVAQQPQADQSLRQDALQSLAYANGAKAGWNLAVADDEAGFAKIMDQVHEAVRTLKQTRAEQPQAEAVSPWSPIKTAPKDCGFLGYQPISNDMWVTAPMYWNGSAFVLLQFFNGDTEHLMSPTHWMPIPLPPANEQKKGGV